jgi:hypothetical protein
MTQTVPSGPLASGTGAPGRARISSRTLRSDRWWVQPAITAAVLFSFVVYATWRAFENAYYYVTPYLSPFYSPCVADNCAPGSDDLGRLVGDWYTLSPALLILVFPLGFLILQNSHRWFFYAGLVFNVILTWDAILGFRNTDGEWGHMGLGTLILLTNATLLWLYSLSCHSCRNTFGGRLKHFSKHPVRYRMWTVISRLNTRHPMFAWLSLFGVAFTDFYIRLLAKGTITDITFF